MRKGKATSRKVACALYFFIYELRAFAKLIDRLCGKMYGCQMSKEKNNVTISFSKNNFLLTLNYLPQNGEMHFPSLNDSSVYQFKNQRNGYVYVGKANSFITRIKRHYWQLIKEKHFCQAIQRDFNNGDEFIASKVEGFSGFEDEQFIIHKFLSCGTPLYNICIAKERK